MIEPQKKCQIQKSSFVLELQEQFGNSQPQKLNVVQCIGDLNKNKQQKQQEDEVLFEEFIRGIPDQCVREVDAQDQDFLNKALNVHQGKNNQTQNVQNENLCDIEQLSGMSSISLVEQQSDQIPSRQNQFLSTSKKGIKQVQNQQHDSQNQKKQSESSQENDQNLPFNAGFGDFLKEMQRLAKDASFEQETHDIWTETTQNNNQNCLQTSKQIQQNSFQKIQNTYIINFSKRKDQFEEIQILITKIESVKTDFLKIQTIQKEGSLNLSQKEQEYIEKLKQFCSLGREIRQMKLKTHFEG